MTNTHKLNKQFAFLSSIIAAVIFSLRYINCLPFSGKMPVVNYEGVNRLASFMIYAKEPFSFPLGLIKGLTFPFHDADVLRGGAIPIFAILFKALSRLYAPLSELYYFGLIEIMAVFFTAYFAYLLLEIFKVRYFLLKLLGVILCALSFSLLARCNYGQPLVVFHFPLYLAFIYFYIQLYRQQSVLNAVKLLAVFIIASSDPYLLYGLCIITCVCLLCIFINSIISGKWLKDKRFRYVLAVFLLAVFIAFNIIYFTAAYDFSKSVPWVTSLVFGFGGGFSVADVFSLVIPPASAYPGGSYLAKIGFPVTTDKLQPGEYEGFAYLGTVALGIICVLIIFNFIEISRNIKSFLAKLKLRFASYFYADRPLPPAFTISIAVFILYILSWGYVIHVFGHKINSIVFTPAGILAEMWYRFFQIRSLGRLAIPLSLLTVIGAVVFLDRYIKRHNNLCSGMARKTFCAFVACTLIVLHIYEIKCFVKPLKATTNVILNVFSQDEVRDIKKILQGKNALFMAPNLRSGHTPQQQGNAEYGRTWDKICYSLAFYTGIPVNCEYDERVREHSAAINADVEEILNGNLKLMKNKYGDIAVASPVDVAQKILEKTNIPLNSHKIKNLVILTFIN